MGQRKWTTYAYGDFDRIEVVYDPQFTVDNQTIEPYTRFDYDGLVTKVTTGVVGNAQTHITQTTLNIMGWTDSKAETIDENGTNNVITYGYNANGSLAWTKVNGMETTKVSISYDNAGNRTGLIDPDYGQVTSQYNAFGQLVQTVSPKGDVTVYQYDNMGRKKLIIETDNNNASQPDRITTWNYSEAAGSKGLLTGVSLREGDVEKQVVAFNYDAQHYNRQASTTETLFGTTHTTTYSYDDQNGFPLRVKEVAYPSGYAIEKGYDATTGNVTEIRHNNQLLWKTHEANAFGQITHYEMGNGVHSYYQYDDRHLLSSQQASKNGNIIQNFGYSYDIFANLAARTEDKFAMPNTETFTYDYLNRLTTVTLNGTTDSDMTYDDLGRILAKEADGQAVFSGAQYNTYDQHGNLKPHAVSSATMAGNPFASPSLDIAYTMFDKVKTLSQYDENENLVGQVAYQYGYDHERIQMTHGNTYEKLYLGNCELITQNGNAQWNTFISGPMGVFAAVTSNGTTESLRYIYKDHLGSWTTLTDDQGTVLQELSFDAWGNLRTSASWSGQYNGVLLYDRGFTGHEHLFSFGLINMNGRMYDPVMSSFLSVDNYVTLPDFSQAFNRYSYCYNNPLKYTDPDGEFPWVPMLIGAGIGVVTNGIDNVCNNQSFFQGAGKAALFGGLQGLASFGIGQVASGIASVGGRVAFQTLAHGTLGGVSTTLNGGNFGTGFLSGAASSLVATGMGSLTQTTDKWGQAIGVIGGGAIAGGVSSSICGGSFWDGFRNGAISSGLNHAVHAGVFGKGLAIASMTGRTRHLWGPDAKAYAGSLEVSAGIATSAEVGGIEIFVGKYKGFHPYSEIGMGAGGLSTSLGVDMIEMYSTSSVSEVQLDDFSGSFEKISLSGTVLPFISIGASASISYHQGNANNLGFTIGIGHSVSLDPMPVNANFTITHGASKAGSFDGLTNELRKSFKIRR